MLLIHAKPIARIGILLALSCTLFAATASAADDACRRIPGPKEKVWSVSATQVGNELVLADIRNEKLLRFHLDRGMYGRLDGPFEKSVAGLWPAAIRSAGDELLLELGGTRQELVKIDRNLALRRTSARKIIGEAREGDATVSSTLIWEPLAGGAEIVSCADVYRGSGDTTDLANYYTGFVTFDYDVPSAFSTLLERPATSPLRTACRLALPLIATLDEDTAYFAVPGPEPGLYRYGREDTTAKRLDQYPKQLEGWLSSEAPEFTRTLFPRLMGEIERTAMPVGLFGWESNLYLLSRRQPAPGEVTWSLTRIDPGSGEAQGTMTIDSDANHLMLVPGDEYWAVVEKGPALTLGTQELRSILTIPAEHLRAWSDGGVLCRAGAPVDL